MQTRVLPVDAAKIGTVRILPQTGDILDDFEINLDLTSQDAQNLLDAAENLRNATIPVAFPTETVYGLGADATRSEAVLGIYKAKQRPADNPLIVHFASLEQLRTLLSPSKHRQNGEIDSGSPNALRDDPIPSIYAPLIQRFWPGPLTIILPNPPHSPLAPEVTAGLTTFGARIPNNSLALSLIKLANLPIAAPSANASTKPSPTAAEHVLHDLDGRIELIIDGGPCSVGVESTVVDGLSRPPLVLRPGGISLEQLRSCPGWEDTQVGYKNVAEENGRPRAPGMKYRHYSPRAPVVLFEAQRPVPTINEMKRYCAATGKLGIIRTRRWVLDPQDEKEPIKIRTSSSAGNGTVSIEGDSSEPRGMERAFRNLSSTTVARQQCRTIEVDLEGLKLSITDLDIGPTIASIAKGVFGALRELDNHHVDAILVEGVEETDGKTAAAVMNRLRKAAQPDSAQVS